MHGLLNAFTRDGEESGKQGPHSAKYLLAIDWQSKFEKV